MSVYEARAELALFSVDRSLATGHTDTELFTGLGRLVTGGGDDVGSVINDGQRLARGALTLGEWREQADSARQTAIAERVRLQANFEPYAAIARTMMAGIQAGGRRRGWQPPPGFTFLNAGDYAYAFRFQDQESGEDLVLKVLRSHDTADGASQVEARAAGMIAADGAAAFGLEQGQAVSYQGAVINRYAPGKPLEEVSLLQAHALGESQLDRALDAIDEAERRGISFDLDGDKNILLDDASDAVPFWVLDFGIWWPTHRRDRNAQAFVKGFKQVSLYNRALSLRQWRALVDPLISYLADGYERRHPDRPDIVQDIRDSIGL